MEDPFPGFSLPKAFHESTNYHHPSPITPTVPSLSILNYDSTSEPIDQPTNEPSQNQQHDQNPSQTSNPIVRRSTRVTKQPSYLQAYHCSLLTSQTSHQDSTKYPLNQYLSYQALSLSFKHSVLQMSTLREPTFYHETVIHDDWKRVMEVELKAMEANHTWIIVPLPTGKNTVGCQWIYKIKHKAAPLNVIKLDLLQKVLRSKKAWITLKPFHL